MGKYHDILEEELLALEALSIELTDGLYPVIPNAGAAKRALTRNDNLHFPLGTTYLIHGFRGVAAIEKSHEERYRALLNNVETKTVFEKSDVQVWECRNCGHMVVGMKAPQVCPVCNHPQSYFEIKKFNY